MLLLNGFNHLSKCCTSFFMSLTCFLLFCVGKRDRRFTVCANNMVEKCVVEIHLLCTEEQPLLANINFHSSSRTLLIYSSAHMSCVLQQLTNLAHNVSCSPQYLNIHYMLGKIPITHIHHKIKIIIIKGDGKYTPT